MKKVPILVVGGAGYIGSHVCLALALEGFSPIIYDNFSNGNHWACLDQPFVEGDLKQMDHLEEVFDRYHPKAVIQLASLISVRDSVTDPLRYYEENLVNTLRLLQVMEKKGVLSLVFSSTAAIYGSPDYTPIDEKHPKRPLNAYGRTKWATEELLSDFSFAGSFRFAALRYFNACGADLKSRIGEAHHPETHLIPLAIQAALGKQVLKIFGDTYPTEDGTAIRDYVHVLDLASAHVKALHYLFDKGENLQANLGTGKGYSVKQIVQELEKIVRKKVPVEIHPRVVYDSPELVADPSLAKKALRWKPQYSDLKTILTSAFQWHQKCDKSKDLLEKMVLEKVT